MIRRFSREDSTDSGSSRYATRKRDDSDSFVSGVDPQWLFNCFFLPKVSRYLAKSRTSGALTSEPKEPTPEESASRRISGDTTDCFAVDEDNNCKHLSQESSSIRVGDRDTPPSRREKLAWQRARARRRSGSEVETTTMTTTQKKFSRRSPPALVASWQDRVLHIC